MSDVNFNITISMEDFTEEARNNAEFSFNDWFMGQCVHHVTDTLGFSAHGIERKLGEAATAVIEERLREAVVCSVDALLQLPIRYDFRKRGNVTFAEVVEARLEDFLEQQVDSNGKVVRPDNRGVPRIEWAIQQAFDRAFKKEIEAATAETKAEIRKRFAEKLGGPEGA